tara:strand:+ start:997 stop:1236 length:240 start_codon:yes stop_codon:yes gene_type:complete
MHGYSNLHPHDMVRRNEMDKHNKIEDAAFRKNFIAACFGDIRASLDALQCASGAGNHEAVKFFHDRITSSVNNLQGQMK